LNIILTALPKFVQGRLTTAPPSGYNSPIQMFDYVFHRR